MFGWNRISRGVATVAIGAIWLAGLAAFADEPAVDKWPLEGTIKEIKPDRLLIKSHDGSSYSVMHDDQLQVTLEGKPARYEDLVVDLYINVWIKPTSRAYKDAVRILAQREKLPYVHPSLRASTPPFPADLAALPVKRTPAAEVAAGIDRQIDHRLQQAGIPASPVADDSVFLRRAYLDITGRVPTLEQTKAFLDSKAPDKRARLIDQLLASPNFGDHFANKWRDLAIYEEIHRFQTKYIEPYRDWLAAEFNANRGWNRMAWSQITAAGLVSDHPEGFYMLTSMQMGQTDASKIGASASRMFLGVDIQCAQCHDHYFVDEWKQDDFWRFAAFFSHVRDEGNVGAAGQTSNTAVLFEADGEPKGRNNDRTPYYTPPTGAKIEIPDPTDPTNYLYEVTAKYLEGPQPELGEKGPYRPQLARWMVDPQNPFFAKAAVNRLWDHFFARGLVNPVDDMNLVNEPTHPELLAQLSAEFTASGTDIKHLIRCICNSQAYQRSARSLPENEADSKLFSHMAVKVLTPDMLADSREAAVGARLAGRDARRYDELFINDELATQLGYGIPHYLRLITSNTRLPDAPRSLDEVYLSVLARLPTEQERKLLADQDLEDVRAALLNSAEFIHNR